MSYRLALAQLDPAPGDVVANLEKIKSAAHSAHGAGAHVLIFPELFLSGISSPDSYGKTSLPAGELGRELASLAAETRLDLLVGFCEKSDADQRLYNSAMYVTQAGQVVALYRKTHPFSDEYLVFAQGDRLFTFPTQYGLAGILICFDIEFPETARSLALRGAQIIYAPTANMAPYLPQQQAYARARACENHVFVAVCNRIGKSTSHKFFGHSLVASPLGQILCEGGEEEEMLIADIDLSQIDESRRVFTYLHQRRPELYG
jgi:predicted amidohydrolase